MGEFLSCNGKQSNLCWAATSPIGNDAENLRVESLAMRFHLISPGKPGAWKSAFSSLDVGPFSSYALTVRTAFKEWAVVVDALARGEQILLLRKGGIAEGKGGFQVEHERFLLYPTNYHNQRDSVIESAQHRLGLIAPASSPPDMVRIEFAAEVVEAVKLESLADAERLRGQHIWRDEVIASRFDWGRDKGIHALALRLHRLARPQALPIVPAYAGCKSWIELEVDFDLNSAMPVINDAAFAEKLQAFRTALAASIAA